MLSDLCYARWVTATSCAEQTGGHLHAFAPCGSAVEEAVYQGYRTFKVQARFIAAVTEQVNVTRADQQALTRGHRHKPTRQLGRLEQREQRLIDLAADAVLDRDRIRERSDAVQLQRRRIELSLRNADAELRLGADASSPA